MKPGEGGGGGVERRGRVRAKRSVRGKRRKGRGEAVTMEIEDIFSSRIKAITDLKTIYFGIWSPKT